MRGVVYFNRGTRCLLRLLVSLHSLVEHWKGEVAILVEGTPPEWFLDIAKSYGAKIIPRVSTHENILADKSSIYRDSPFDTTVFLDSDTVILDSIDELFSQTEFFGCAVTRFNDWHTYRGRMKARIQAWNPIAPAGVARTASYQWAINTGVIGWVKGSPVMPKYEKMTRAGIGVPGIARKTLDEIAMQLVIPGEPHCLMGKEWNISPVHGTSVGGKIMHYHGQKHCREGANFLIWKTAYREMVEKNQKWQKTLTFESGDDSHQIWIREQLGVRNDITIVSAVNPQYAALAEKNLALWLKTPGLAGNRFLFFVNGFSKASSREFLNHPNVTIVRWNYPHEANTRETMLAAFINGVAKHVRTDFWMKLDCDARPLRSWDWPDYRNNTIVSHRWGYTKMKGDPTATKHWFNRLDAFFSPDCPMFNRALDVKSDFKVSHRSGNPNNISMRFASFCHIEKASFTRRVAGMIAAGGGKLPIPSHDTIAWYCATLWKEKVHLMNMKEYFSP